MPHLSHFSLGLHGWRRKGRRREEEKEKKRRKKVCFCNGIKCILDS